MNTSTSQKRTPGGNRASAEQGTKRDRILARVGADRNLALVGPGSEPRVDSRLVAQQLGNGHRPVMALIDRYADEIRRHGQLLFEKAVGERQQGGGNPERSALLNEDQAFFLLTLSRNTPRVVSLKSRLVQAFQEARRAADIRRTEYLPTYHHLHDAVHLLAHGSTHERFVHLNINRLVNKVAGIEPGTRGRAPVPQQALLITAQMIAAGAMRGATDHREGYERVKAALEPLDLSLQRLTCAQPAEVQQ